MNPRLKKVIDHPLHQSLGITSIDAENGNGRFTITIGDSALNPFGALHGGVVYLLCDVCAYAGLLSVMESHTQAVTHDIHVSIMKSAKLGDRVEFASQLIKRGKHLCFISVRASVSGRVIASANITKSLIPVSSNT